jgi:AraC-like DNA-binding protein
MGELGEYLCFLVTRQMPHPVDHTIKTRLLLRPISSPLGTIRLGGVNKGGFGVGMPPAPRRTLNCYGFAYILDGHGQYEDATIPTTKLGKGDTVLFFPGRPHRCGTLPGEFWDELWFEFEGPVFNLMRKTGVLDPRKPLHHATNSDHWFRRFFQIIPPVHLRQKTSAQVIVSRFASVLTEILADNETADEPPQAGDDWLSAACAMLSTPDTGKASHPSAVARKLGLSYETFRKKFREAAGFSPGHYLLDSRIDRAAALLHQGRFTIKEIASQMDFCDEFYFSRCFKRRFGQSPRAFRQRVRGG